MENKYITAKALLEKYNQMHLLNYYDDLNESNKQELLDDILSIDFEQVKAMVSIKETVKNKENIQPLFAKTLDEYSVHQIAEVQSQGEQIIKSGKYAVVTMAGGQGTRLGHNGPKGTFSLNLKSGSKYIFEILTEKLLQAYSKYGVYIPWYIMTSKANDSDTKAFFKEHKYFGYPKEKIRFFEQGELAITDTEGNLVLENEHKVFKAADGNGGIFNAMSRNGIVDEMKQIGIEWVLITGVDNILANFADEIYLGIVQSEGKLNGVKSVAKTSPEEKVGVFCKRDSHPGIIEYSEMTDEMKYAKDDMGNLKYKEANIVNHLLNIKVLDKIKNESLPIHKAYKKLDYISKEGKYIKGESPNAFKYEAFIFDYFTKVDDVTIYRVNRSEEFAPVKNKEGIDSPETAIKLYDAINN